MLKGIWEPEQCRQMNRLSLFLLRSLLAWVQTWCIQCPGTQRIINVGEKTQRKQLHSLSPWTLCRRNRIEKQHKNICIEQCLNEKIPFLLLDPFLKDKCKNRSIKHNSKTWNKSELQSHSQTGQRIMLYYDLLTLNGQTNNFI